MPSRSVFTFGSVAACTALLALTGATGAQAATPPVAKASASAVTVTVLGTPIGSGTYQATNDGKESAATGTNEPDATALSGQSVLADGVLGQLASTDTVAKQGVAWSCAGLAGDNATRTAGTDCLTPANAVDLRLGSVDLSGMTVVSRTVTNGLNPTDSAAVMLHIQDVKDGLAAALRTGLTSYGTPQVVLRMDAAQASCTSDRTGSTATTSLDAASLRVVTPGQSDLVLADLPDAPTAGDQVAADVAGLPAQVTDALRADLTAAFTTAMAGTPVDTAAVMDNLLVNLRRQLAAFDDDLVTVALNQQSQPKARSITVTALDLRVGQSLSQFGVDDSRLQVGRVSCASAARVAAPTTGGTTTGGTTTGTTGGVKAPTAAGTSKVPAKVDAGLAVGPNQAGVVLAVGMLVLGIGAGAVGSHLVGRRRT